MKDSQFRSENEKQLALFYIKALVDTAREPFLILDSKLRVIFANDYFLKTFRVAKEDTEREFLYNLGKRQWDILKLRNLLEEILPNKKIIDDYEVTNNFPKIGLKTILLNARQIDTVQLIILCFEDITIKKEQKKKR